MYRDTAKKSSRGSVKKSPRDSGKKSAQKASIGKILSPKEEGIEKRDEDEEVMDFLIERIESFACRDPSEARRKTRIRMLLEETLEGLEELASCNAQGKDSTTAARSSVGSTGGAEQNNEKDMLDSFFTRFERFLCKHVDSLFLPSSGNNRDLVDFVFENVEGVLCPRGDEALEDNGVISPPRSPTSVNSPHLSPKSYASRSPPLSPRVVPEEARRDLKTLLSESESSDEDIDSLPQPLYKISEEAPSFDENPAHRRPSALPPQKKRSPEVAGLRVLRSNVHGRVSTDDAYRTCTSLPRPSIAPSHRMSKSRNETEQVRKLRVLRGNVHGRIPARVFLQKVEDVIEAFRQTLDYVLSCGRRPPQLAAVDGSMSSGLDEFVDARQSASDEFETDYRGRGEFSSFNDQSNPSFDRSITPVLLQPLRRPRPPVVVETVLSEQSTQSFTNTSHPTEKSLEERLLSSLMDPDSMLLNLFKAKSEGYIEKNAEERGVQRSKSFDVRQLGIFAAQHLQKLQIEAKAGASLADTTLSNESSTASFATSLGGTMGSSNDDTVKLANSQLGEHNHSSPRRRSASVGSAKTARTCDETSSNTAEHDSPSSHSDMEMIVCLSIRNSNGESSNSGAGYAHSNEGSNPYMGYTHSGGSGSLSKAATESFSKGTDGGSKHTTPDIENIPSLENVPSLVMPGDDDNNNVKTNTYESHGRVGNPCYIGRRSQSSTSHPSDEDRSFLGSHNAKSHSLSEGRSSSSDDTSTYQATSLQGSLSQASIDRSIPSKGECITSGIHLTHVIHVSEQSDEERSLGIPAPPSGIELVPSLEMNLSNDGQVERKALSPVTNESVAFMNTNSGSNINSNFSKSSSSSSSRTPVAEVDGAEFQRKGTVLAPSDDENTPKADGSSDVPTTSTALVLRNGGAKREESSDDENVNGALVAFSERMGWQDEFAQDPYRVAYRFMLVVAWMSMSFLLEINGRVHVELQKKRLQIQEQIMKTEDGSNSVRRDDVRKALPAPPLN